MFIRVYNQGPISEDRSESFNPKKTTDTVTSDLFISLSESQPRTRSLEDYDVVTLVYTFCAFVFLLV